MSEDAIGFDTVLDLCGNQYRRIVLAVLMDEQRSVTLRDLTTKIFELDHQAAVADACAEVLTEIRAVLHHVHIPKLESVGVVEYDPDRRVVAPTEQFAQLQPTLSEIINSDTDIQPPGDR